MKVKEESEKVGILKSRDITLANKGQSSQGYGFSCGHVWM